MTERNAVKYVLFRIPKDTSVSDLDGLEIDLSDLKVTSDKGFRAVTDRATIPERGSACPLIPEGDVLKCGGSFIAHVQLVRDNRERVSKKKRSSTGKETVPVKAESGVVKKSKKVVKEQGSSD